MIRPDQWYGIECSALTAIRREWSVSKLEEMAEEGHPTPASGDAL